MKDRKELISSAPTSRAIDDPDGHWTDHWYTRWLYYGNGSQLEYDFVVFPGANPRWITLVNVTVPHNR